MTERLLIIDPGERVGWCKVTVQDGVLNPDTFVVGVHPIKVFAEALAGKTIVPAACDGEVEYDRLVYEKWVLYADKAEKLVGSEMASSQVVGMIRLCGWIGGCKLSQLPANKKKNAATIYAEHLPWLAAKKALCSEEHSKDVCDLLAYYWYLTEKRKKVAPRG